MKRRSFYKERINTPFIVGIEEMIMLKTIGRLNIVFTYGKVREQRLIQVIQVQGISIISQWVSRNCCLYVKEKAAPYSFIGLADYVSHTDSKPMNIIWKMKEPIPAKYLRKTNKMIVG